MLNLLSVTDIPSILYRQEGLAREVLQWYLCRLEAWFAADADMISLQSWDQASAVFDHLQLIVLWLHIYWIDTLDNTGNDLKCCKWEEK